MTGRKYLGETRRDPIAAPRLASGREAVGGLLGILLTLLGITACAAPHRPGLSQPPDPSIRQLPSRALNRVRILLRSDFLSATIENSRRGDTLDVLPVSGRLILVAPDSRALAEAGGFRFQPAPGRLLSLDGVAYRGVLEAFINPLGRPVVVNELSLENYLRGVVPNELGPDKFPLLDALKAQSVAARTYALAGRRRFDHLGFDLYADERSQVYLGPASEHPLSDQAVRETAGRVVMFDGRPIEAFYSSTCGGLTADYAEVFEGEPIPYLAGGSPCPDQESRYHRWTVEIDPSAIRGILDHFAGVGRLRNLEILRRGSTGRVTAMRFRGGSGERVLGGLDARRALGLRSHYLDSVKVDRDRDGWAVRVRIDGRGFGHGVGMCQVGAVSWARRGKDFEEILQFYYRGTKVEDLY